jgi:hypothetical protein
MILSTARRSRVWDGGKGWAFMSAVVDTKKRRPVGQRR